MIAIIHVVGTSFANTEFKILAIYYGWVSEILMLLVHLSVLWYTLCVVVYM